MFHIGLSLRIAHSKCDVDSLPNIYRPIWLAERKGVKSGVSGLNMPRRLLVILGQIYNIHLNMSPPKIILKGQILPSKKLRVGKIGFRGERESLWIIIVTSSFIQHPKSELRIQLDLTGTESKRQKKTVNQVRFQVEIRCEFKTRKPRWMAVTLPVWHYQGKSRCTQG